MSQPHVLITGGAGFIGSYLAETLIARDCRVTVIDDESTGDPDNLSGVMGHFHFSYHKATAADKILLRRVLGDIDVVYHLAAAVGVHLVSAAPIHTIETNVYLTELMLSELLRQQRQGRSVKLFLASSSEVYGKNDKEKCAELDDLIFGATCRPRWAYGASKALDEFLALAYHREQNLPVVIGRFFNIVGPRQTARFGMVLPRFCEAALAGQSLIVHDDGQQIRSFCHVRDAVDAMLALMKTPEAIGEVVNIGDEEPVSILELAKHVTAMVANGKPVSFQPYTQAYGEDFDSVPSRVPDLSKLRKLTGHKSSYMLDTIIREVIDTMRSKARR